MTDTNRKVHIEKQVWPIEKEFRISRGARTEAHVVVVSITEGHAKGQAEAVPTTHYNETIDTVIAQIKWIAPKIEKGLDIASLNQQLSPGAARNALDCALWDLKAKKEQRSVSDLHSIAPFISCETAQTISIGPLEKMASEAALLKDYPLIKIKIDSGEVIAKIKAISEAAPNSRLIIDANEAWNIHQLNSFSSQLQKNNIALIEQPLPMNSDSDLLQYTGSIPICADESIHTTDDLERVAKLYSYINIKLDKTGGLTEAIKLLHTAKAKKMGIMIGCMVGTSLAMAPAALLTQHADFVDLDGPALLKKDRANGFTYDKGIMSNSSPELWGYPCNYELF